MAFASAITASTNTTGFAPAPVVWHLPYEGAHPPRVEILRHPLDLPALPPDRQAADAAALARIFTAPGDSASTSTSTTTTSTEQDLFQRLIEGQPVSQWVRDFGNVTWHRLPDDPAPETLRARVIDGLGGRRSDRGRAVSGQLSLLGHYLRDLKKIRDEYLKDRPPLHGLIEAEADRLMRNATSRMAEGGGVGDAASDFRFAVDPQLARTQEAQEAAARQAARSASDHQAQDIEYYWRQRHFYKTLRISPEGVVDFLNVEQMNRYCPPGGYEESIPILRWIRGKERRFIYPHSDVVTVRLLVEGGRMEAVHFSGRTWILARRDRPYVLRRADEQPPASPYRRSNPHWNPDPVVVFARIFGSRRPPWAS